MSSTKKTNSKKKKKSTSTKKVAKKEIKAPIVEQEVEMLEEVSTDAEELVLKEPVVEENELILDETEEIVEETKIKGLDRRQKEIKAPRIIPKEEERTFKKDKKKESIAVARFEVSHKTGLSSTQVEQRIAEGKTNKVDNKNTKTYRSIILGNIFTFFNLLSFVIAGALLSVGSWGDCFFMIIVFANMGIGIIQEIKAKKTIEKISLVSSPKAFVVRDKVESKIDVSEVVLDDILVLQTS